MRKGGKGSVQSGLPCANRPGAIVAIRSKKLPSFKSVLHRIRSSREVRRGQYKAESQELKCCNRFALSSP